MLAATDPKIKLLGCMQYDDKAELQEKVVTHQAQTSQGYQILHADIEGTKETMGLAVITFELMQNLFLPSLTHSSI